MRVDTLNPPAMTSRPLKVFVAFELVCRIFPPEMVRPLEEERPPAFVEEIPPANVEVALFPTIVVVAVPPMYRVSSMENLVEEAWPVKRALPAIVNRFPASKVSEASLLRNCAESSPSSVAASPPPPADMQLLLRSA